MYLLKYSRSRFGLSLSLALPLFLAVSCADVAVKKVELNTTPVGAEVKTLDGVSLGVTPLVLKGDALSRVSKNGRMTVTLSAPGYLERECTLDIHGEDSHEIALTKLSDDFFAKSFTRNFSRQANQMARELLVVRELIQMRKLDEAEKMLLTFQQAFPNIAASYVMLADIALIRGQTGQARQYLVKAQDIDPNDSEVARLLLRESSQGGGK